MIQSPEGMSGNLGSCCGCGASGPQVRNILMLDRRAPEPGTGWGCLECDLPCDGAIAVLCDKCILAIPIGHSPKFACCGFPYENRRMPYDQLDKEEFNHDRSKHPEEVIQ